jgi:predicted RND superfamily exporter protein
MILAYLAPLCIVLGALVYALASNPKVAEMGRLLYAAAVLAVLLAIGMAHVVHLP